MCGQGHSATNAALLSAEVGFDSLWFARIDYQDRATRLANKNMQFLWQASPSLGKDATVSAHTGCTCSVSVLCARVVLCCVYVLCGFASA